MYMLKKGTQSNASAKILKKALRAELSALLWDLTRGKGLYCASSGLLVISKAHVFTRACVEGKGAQVAPRVKVGATRALASCASALQDIIDANAKMAAAA